jgi:short-subunit dehydrogenase
VGYWTGRVVVITGASAGIGRAVAVELARQGAVLALSGRDRERLAQTRELCAAAPQILVDQVDVTDRAAVFDHADRVVGQFGRVDAVIASAGIIHVGGLTATDPGDFQRLMNVDYFGVIHCAQAFLDHLIAAGNDHPSGRAHIATLSSGLGLIGMASHTAYCGAKFAVRGFTEALCAEMRARRHPVAVSCVFPGGVQTDIMKTGTYSTDASRSAVTQAFDQHVVRLSAQDAARILLRRVAQGKPHVMVGPDARAVALATRLSGPTIERFVGPLQRRIRPRRTH